MNIFTISIITLVTIISISIIYYKLTWKVRAFDRNFHIDYQQIYSVGHIYQIKLLGNITPISDNGRKIFDTYSSNFNISFSNTTISGNVYGDRVNINMIRKKDKKTALRLLKKTFIKELRSTIREIETEYKTENKLKEMASKEKNKLTKMACQECRYKYQCGIAFTECKYEKEKINFKIALLDDKDKNNEELKMNKRVFKK